MLELALGRALRRVRNARIFACWALALAFCGLAAAGADISVETLQISVVQGTSGVDRSALGFGKAIVGDTVRVSALVRNDDTAAVGEFEVDFFFTETISGEHGRLGTQVVSGLEPEDSKRPVIVFDTSSFSPGIYAFSAEADPRGDLADSDLCDNAAPRGECAGEPAESPSKYSLTLLREGRHISQLKLSSPYPLCPMGSQLMYKAGGTEKLGTRLTVVVYNVGTQPLSAADLDVYGYYRLGLTPPADTFTPLVTDASDNPVELETSGSLGDPGSVGSILVTLDYGVFAHLFAPGSAARTAHEVLGRTNAAQIRITVEPVGGGGVPQDLFLPAQFELSQFHSTVDLWTFPEAPSCCSEACDTVASTAAEPAVAGGLVFHVAGIADGDRLYVLKVRTGEEKGTWDAPAGTTLTSPLASYDEDNATYRAYVGASNGHVYALEGTEKEEGAFLVQLWESAADDVVEGNTYLAFSSDNTNTLVAGSEAGAFVLDAATGATLREVTSHKPVTSAPVYNTATGTLWAAVGESVFRIPASGSECSYDAGSRVSTALVGNAKQTSLFFGTETGYVYAINPLNCVELDGANLLQSAVGISVVSSGDDAVIYLSSDNGDMVRVEYDQRSGFDADENAVKYTARTLKPTNIAEAPAVLPNVQGNDARVVFVTGEKREGGALRPVLQAWDSDLEGYETVQVWGTDVSFVFKLKETGGARATLLRPVVDPDPETPTLLVTSTDGYLYAFDLSQFK